MKARKQLIHILLVIITMVSFQTHANGIKDVTWYLSVDIDQVQNNETLRILYNNSENVSIDIESIPKELSHITIYGNSKGSEDATAIISGDFSHFSMTNFVINYLYSREDISEQIKDSTIVYHDQEIRILSIESQHENKNKEVYFSKVSNDLSVISLDLNEVESWIDGAHDTFDVNNGSLFSVVVNVESALAHMGVNLDENRHMLQSEIFQKVSQVSASVSEIVSDIVIEISLSAKDDVTATHIEQVINGLLAMNNLSNANDKNELHKLLIQNLSIERNANNVLLNTYAPLTELKKMNFHKHHNEDDNVEVKIKPLKFN